jgi:NADH dehydrogenase [ubiquinone] 1 alpha subcomplex assembly factor 6
VSHRWRTTTVLAQQRQQRTFATSSKTSRPNESYCVDLVQLRDREAYYAGLLWPATNRDAYFVLRAFNVEIASIKDPNRSSSETSALALQLRMQWWRDAVASIYDTDDDDSRSAAGATTTGGTEGLLLSARRRSLLAFENPVVQALATVQSKYPLLTRQFLDRIIDAREADLEVRQYQTVAALSHYADSTVCSLLYLTLDLCLADGTDQNNMDMAAADEMAYHAGLGIGLTTALRGTPYRLSSSNNPEMPIPVELLGEQFRITENDDIETNEPFRAACRELAMMATDHFVQARSLQGQLLPHQRPVFLTMVPSIHYLSRLATADYNVFDPTALASGAAGNERIRLLLFLARSWLTGVY